MKNKILPIILTWAIIWETVVAPVAYANGGLTIAGGDEAASIDQLEAMVGEFSAEGQTLWKDINQLVNMLYGTEEETAKLEEVLKNQKNYDGRLAREQKNSDNWSVISFMKLLYSNEDKNGVYTNFFTKGFSDPFAFRVPYEHETFQRFLERAKAISAQFKRVMGNDRITQDERLVLALVYTIRVYGNVEAFLSLFASDRKNDAKRVTLLSDIRPILPQSLINAEIKTELENEYKMVLTSIDTDYTTMGRSYPKYVLSFHPMQRLKNQFLLHLAIPTSHFYLKATRTRTLMNMMDQLYYYQTALGDSRPVELPRSCQLKLGNSFPKQISFPIPSAEEQKEIMNAMLFENGHLLYEGANMSDPAYTAYREYYIDYIEADLQFGGFTGLLPHEEYFASQKALNLKAYDQRLDRIKLFDTTELYYEEPVIDDVTHFDQIIGGKNYQVELILEEQKQFIEHLHRDTEVRAPNGEKMNFYEYRKHIFGDLESLYRSLIMFDEADYQVEGRTIDTIGLNKYMIDKMLEKKTPYWEDIVPQSVIDAALARQVQIKMPPLHSPDSWRRWAINRILELFEQYLDPNIDTAEYPNFQVLRVPLQACSNTPRPTPSVCLTDGARSFRYPSAKDEFIQARKVMQNALDYLRAFRDDGTVLHKINFDTDKLAAIYPWLQRVWEYAQGVAFWAQKRGIDVFADSIPTEWDFLVGQIGYNPWAALRLSHLLIEEEFPKMKSVSNLEDAAKESIHREYLKIAKILGIDKILTPFHANQLLTIDERKYFWKTVSEIKDEKNFYLFKAKHSENQIPYYLLLRKINDTNLFTRDSITEALQLVGNNTNHDASHKDLRDVYYSKEYEQISALRAMYEAVGNPDRLSSLADDFFDRYGVASTREIKAQFLDMESRIKTPIYHLLIKESAYLQKNTLMQNMDTLCMYYEDPKELDADRTNAYAAKDRELINKLNNHIDRGHSPRDDYTDLFVATSKASQQINQEFEIAVPKVTRAMADRMSDDDWRSMLWGFGSAAMYMVSIALTGGATLGLAPVVASSLASVLSIGSLAAEGFCIAAELAHHDDAEYRIDLRAQLASLGSVAAEEDQDIRHGYIWTALEVAFSANLIGQLFRSMQHTARTLKAVKAGAFKNLNKLERLAKYRSISRQVMTLTSKSILNMYHKTFGKFGQKGWLRHGVSSLKIQFLAEINEKSSLTRINQHFGKVLANYFNNSSDEFVRFLSKFPTAKYEKAVQKMQTLARHGKAGSRRFLKWQTKAAELADSYTKAVKLLDNAKVMARRGGDLSEFIIRNADDICDIAPKFSFHLGELPYIVFVEGAPPGNRRLAFNRLIHGIAPGISEVNDRRLVQRIASARNLLISEKQIFEAGKTMGLTVFNPAPVQLLKTFDDLISDVAMNGKVTEAAAEEILRHQEQLHLEMAATVIKYIKESKVPFTTIPRHPILQSIKGMGPEQFVLELKKGTPSVLAAFSATPADLLYGLKIAKDTSHKVFTELGKQQNISVSEFEKLLSALRIRALATNPRKFLPEVDNII